MGTVMYEIKFEANRFKIFMEHSENHYKYLEIIY